MEIDINLLKEIAGPTMEWDTAAGQALLECSGGAMTTAEGDLFLYYEESLLNGSFLCICQ